MFDVGASELLVIVIVAVLVIGPKDLPLALRTAGRWIGKMRRISAHLRSGLDAMVREAEMQDMEAKWRDQNARIMAEHPGEDMAPLGVPTQDVTPADSAGANDAAPAADAPSEEPQLPLDKPSAG